MERHGSAAPLPDDLVEMVVAQVLTKVGDQRWSELDRLAAAHPQHSTALRQLVADVVATDRRLTDALAHQDAAPPHAVGDYVIEHQLGRGGMGVVYAAVQRTLGRRVALKVLSMPTVGHEHRLERFQRESRLLARLEHKGIVRVIDAGTANGTPFYAMDYVDGAPLSVVIDAVRRHGMAGATGATIDAAILGATDQTTDAAQLTQRSPARSYVQAAVELAAQVADALGFAHAAGVIHRDVKPSNVLLRRDGTAVLSDFGLAYLAGEASLTMSGGLTGTPLYASPEQARGASLDHRTDLFSLGVTLYEVLTLVRPFAAEESGAVLYKIQREEPCDPRTHNPLIPAELSAIVLKALAKEPSHRYPGAGEFAADLRALLAGEPVSAHPPTPVQRAWRWCRREPWKAAAIGIAATATVALAATSLVFTRRLLAENTATKKALTLAERDFAKANQAVDEMLIRVADRDLSDVPQMEAVRRDLLQRALSFYEGFTATHGDDIEVRLRLATARVCQARIRRQLEELQPAIDQAVTATTELDALLASSPDDARLIFVRADAQLILAETRALLGQVDIADRGYVEVLATLDALTPAAAQEQERRKMIAAAHVQVATLNRFRDPVRARASYERGVAELAVLTKELPNDASLAARLASARLALSRSAQNAADNHAAEIYLREAEDDLMRAPNSVGVRVMRCAVLECRAVLYKQIGRLEDAAGEADKCVKAFAELAAAFPHTPRLRLSLGDAYINLGNIYRHQAQYDAAIATTRQGVEQYEELVKSWPESVDFRAALARGLLGLSSMLARTDRARLRAQGRPILDRARELADRLHAADSDNAETVRLLADCIGEEACCASIDGDHARALDLYERAAAVWGNALAEHPDSAFYQDHRALMQREAAAQLIALGDPAQAITIVDQSLEALRQGLTKEPRDPTRRRFLRYGLETRAQACAEVGEHAAANAALTELVQLVDSGEEGHLRAVQAVWLANNAGAAQREGYHATAIAALSAAVKHGYRDSAALTSDKRFADLRADPAFQALLQQMTQ